MAVKSWNKKQAEVRKRPVVFDEECPETTPERALKFRRVNPRKSHIAKGA